VNRVLNFFVFGEFILNAMLLKSHNLCACFDVCDFVSFDSVEDQSRCAHRFSL